MLRAEQSSDPSPVRSRSRSRSRSRDYLRPSPYAGPDDLKLNVQHMNYVSCLIKWFHLHARAPHACAAGSLLPRRGASCLLPSAWSGPTWPTTYSRERTNWGPEARADCRLIKMVIVFSGGAQRVRGQEGGKSREREEVKGGPRRLQRLFMCGFCKNY